MKKINKIKNKISKTTLEKLIDKINTLGTSHYGWAQYTSDTYHACAHGSNCCDNDFCRCGVIQNARVTSINIDYIAKTLMSDCAADDFQPILMYCVDRTLRSSKAIDLNSWEVNVSSGYYGQEVHGVKLIDKVKSELIQMFSELDPLAPVDKIKKLLEYEYGFLLPRLEACNTVQVIEVPTDKIKLFNIEYLRKVSKETVEYYKEYALPRAICTKDGDYYSVVDGYHRMLAAHKNKLPTITIIAMT